MGRKLVSCVCNFCGNTFDKPKSESDRNAKFNRPNYCNRTCSGKSNLKNIKNNIKYDISIHSGNKKDEYSDFKYHYRNIKKRNKDIEISIEDLKIVWDDQNGVCPFSGIKLELNRPKNRIYSASLDRIDSSKGYIKNNIRWVSRPINLMKNDMLDSEVWELCENIKTFLMKKTSEDV